jgi:hypothetical protein
VRVEASTSNVGGMFEAHQCGIVVYCVQACALCVCDSMQKLHKALLLVTEVLPLVTVHVHVLSAITAL